MSKSDSIARPYQSETMTTSGATPAAMYRNHEKSQQSTLQCSLYIFEFGPAQYQSTGKLTFTSRSECGGPEKVRNVVEGITHLLRTCQVLHEGEPLASIIAESCAEVDSHPAAGLEPYRLALW